MSTEPDSLERGVCGGLAQGSAGLFTGLLTALVVYLMARRCRNSDADPHDVKPDENTANTSETIDPSQVDRFS